MRNDRDLNAIPENRFDRLSQDELFRIVVDCRENTDPKDKGAQAQPGKMLIAKDIDRVKGIVETFRHPEAPEVRVEESDVDDVVDSSYERLVKMLRTFKGISEGEYRAAMRTCVRFECMDHCREAMGHDKRRAGFLDERTKDDEGDERGPVRSLHRRTGKGADGRGGGPQCRP